jgi:hypothetical protein
VRVSAFNFAVLSCEGKGGAALEETLKSFFATPGRIIKGVAGKGIYFPEAVGIFSSLLFCELFILEDGP